MKNFPTWEESLNGITDSRIVGHAKINPKDVNLAKAGARIMYDRLYIMLNASQQGVENERAETCRCNRKPIVIRCNACGGLVPVKPPAA